MRTKTSSTERCRRRGNCGWRRTVRPAGKPAPRPPEKGKHRGETAVITSLAGSISAVVTQEVDMKVGVLGSGDVAKTLASGFLKHGHQVMLGSRTPEKLKDWAAANAAGKTGTFADAAAFAELVVLAVKGSAAWEALRRAGETSL